VGILAALLVALSPYCVFISQELRPYSQMAFMALASAYFFLRFLETGSWKFWLWTLLFTIGATYSHVLAWSLLVVENLFFFLQYKRYSKFLLSWLGLQLGVLLVFSPIILATLTILKASGVTPDSVAPTGVKVFIYTVVKKGFGAILHLSSAYYFKDLPLRRLLEVFSSPLRGLTLIVMVITPWILLLRGIRAHFRLRNWGAYYILLIFAVPLSSFVIEGTNPNYYANSSPAFMAILALGLSGFNLKWRRLLGLACIFISILGLTYLWSSPTNTYLGEDYQGVEIGRAHV
jgi:hypothetical protein